MSDTDGYRVHPITVSTHVPADPAIVFEFISDTRNDPVWCPNVTEVTQVDGVGVGVGSSFRFHQRVEARGRVLDSDVDVEIVELGERSIRWRVEDRFQVRDVSVEVTPDRAGSLVTQTTTAVFKRKPGLAKWVYPKLARRTFQDQFGRLAEHFR
ncbi:MAG TPA: SRPBCC family protein [Acidimicrobiia bacterium]|nr:SRPBCC family protein [Acidimicrobiia bacterium]